MEKDEQDARSKLSKNWVEFLEGSQKRQEEFALKQIQEKKDLIKTINGFNEDVVLEARLRRRVP
eukprot:14391036-Heterocapsa_arctica.AAC.1